MQVRELLRLEANVLAHDGDRHTALHVAAMRGHVGVLKLLAEAGGLQLCSRHRMRAGLRASARRSRATRTLRQSSRACSTT